MNVTKLVSKREIQSGKFGDMTTLVGALKKEYEKVHLYGAFAPHGTAHSEIPENATIFRGHFALCIKYAEMSENYWGV